MDLSAIRIALAASPNNVPLLLLVAKMEEDQFGIMAARELLDRVVTIDARNRDALLGIARLLDFSGESSQAIVRLEDLCTRDPTFAAAWLLRARLTLDEREAARARQFYDKAVELDRTHADDQGVCLAGLLLNRACSRNDFHGFFAVISVIIEGIVE